MRQKKGILGLALLALLALTITATVGAAASASGGTAVVAKKKKKRCKKKKKKHSATSAKKKKKKCKKKKQQQQQPPQTPATPVSAVRATLTWTGGADNTDYDLYVFDPSGSFGRAASNPIPSSTFSPNAVGPTGNETFTDLDFGQHRAFAFGVCYQDGGSNPVTYSIDYVTADGAHHTDSQTGEEGFNARYSGGAPAMNTFTCPAP
ncbi:MAG: hypothetical protein WB771_04930 [Solirubrobacterales bacterium]